MIDDDVSLLNLTAQYFKGNGWRLIQGTGENSLELIKWHSPLLVVLEPGISGSRGLELGSKIRKTYELPIILISNEANVEARVRGLKGGADDYLIKPIDPGELLARIEAVLRRLAPANIEKAKLKSSRFTRSLEINAETRRVNLNGRTIDLTTMEYDILALFADHPGTVLSRKEIMSKLRGTTYNNFNRSIDLIMSRLRQKLNDDPKNPMFFKTVWGKGYLFLPKLEHK